MGIWGHKIDYFQNTYRLYGFLKEKIIVELTNISSSGQIKNKMYQVLQVNVSEEIRGMPHTRRVFRMTTVSNFFPRFLLCCIF